MKENFRDRSAKSISKQKKILQKEIDFYYLRCFEQEIVTNYLVDINEYCYRFSLNKIAVYEILDFFPHNCISEERAPRLMLDWIKFTRTTTRPIINRSLKKIENKTPELVEKYKDISFATEVNIRYYFRDENRFMQSMRLRLKLYKYFHNYLLRVGILEQRR